MSDQYITGADASAVIDLNSCVPYRPVMHDLGIAVNCAKEHPHAAFVFGSVHTETHPPRHSNHEGQYQDMLYKITLPLQDAQFDVQLCCAVSVLLKLFARVSRLRENGKRLYLQFT